MSKININNLKQYHDNSTLDATLDLTPLKTFKPQVLNKLISLINPNNQIQPISPKFSLDRDITAITTSKKELDWINKHFWKLQVAAIVGALLLAAGIAAFGVFAVPAILAVSAALFAAIIGGMGITGGIIGTIAAGGSENGTWVGAGFAILLPILIPLGTLILPFAPLIAHSVGKKTFAKNQERLFRDIEQMESYFTEENMEKIQTHLEQNITNIQNDKTNLIKERNKVENKVEDLITAEEVNQKVTKLQEKAFDARVKDDQDLLEKLAILKEFMIVAE